MTARTVEEVEEFCTELWCSGGHFDYPTVKVKKVQKGWDIAVQRMYEPPILNLDVLMKLASFFGTIKIDDDRFSWGGCETCDYGSSYGFDLTIRCSKEESCTETNTNSQ